MTNLSSILIFFYIFTLADGCVPILNETTMFFDCSGTTTISEFDIYNFTLAELDAVRSVIVLPPASAVTSGPLRFIPPNLCLFRHLQTIDFSRNSITEPDPTESLTDCLTGLTEINLNANQISEFPSWMIYNMPNLVNLYFQGNRLQEIPLTAFRDPASLRRIDFSSNQLSTWELWTLLVQENANLRNNPMTKVGNKYFFSFPYNSTNWRNVDISSTEIFTLTDAIFPMYNVCPEATNLESVILQNPSFPEMTFLYKLGWVAFHETQFNCSCAQYYIMRSLTDGTGGNPNIPLFASSCTNNVTFNSATSCDIESTSEQSTVDFTQVIPRQCKVNDAEEGNLTVTPNFTRPTSSLASNRYPRYVTRHSSTGACYCTFLSTTTMSVRCLSGTTDSSLRWDNQTFPPGYLDNITRVELTPPMSSLPSYLCTLPSREINLRSQNFLSLTDSTFPCLDTYRKVDLAFNQLTFVRTATGNFTTLEYLDLSSNNLTTIPATLLRPSPSSLRYLDLRNNSIQQLDLVIFTLRNITVLLDNNPINTGNYTNVLNVSVTEFVNNSTAAGTNLTLPVNSTTSVFIINDQQILQSRACTPDAIRDAVSAMSRFYNSTRLDCSCASIRIKLIFSQNGLRLTDTYACSSATQTDIFNALVLGNCSNPADFSVCTTQTSSTTVSPPAALGNSPSSGQGQSNQTGLIVGLVVGLVGFALLIGAVIGLAFYFKNKGSPSKPIGRAAAVGNGPEKSAQSRAPTRNPRAVKLAPLGSIPSKLPPGPVVTVVPTASVPPPLTTTTSKADSVQLPPLTRTESRPPPSRGIPLRLDPIRSPTNVTPQYVPLQSTPSDANSSSFRPIARPSLQAKPSDGNASKLRPNEMLNFGGDNQY